MTHVQFTKVGWQNGSGGGTPESAANLSNDEDRIDLIDAFWEHFGGTDGTWGAPPAGVRYLRFDGTSAVWRTLAQFLGDLSLDIGVDVQAYDALLQSISGLSMVADRFIYGTGTDAVALGTITAFGRSLIDDASDAAARATLGLGSIATQNASNVTITGGTATLSSLTTTGDVTVGSKLQVDGPARAPIVTLTYSSSITPDANNGHNFQVTASGNFTMNAVANAQEGMVFNFIIKKSGTGRQITWAAAYKFPNGNDPQLSNGSNPDVFSFIYDGTSFLPAGLNLS